MVMIKILYQSFRMRRLRLLVSTLALTFSVTLLLMLEHIDEAIHHHAKRFASTTDLLVSAPAQPVQLALFGLFRIGPPPPALSSEVHASLKNHPEIASAVPVATGESHRGVLVTGTTDDYLTQLHTEGLLPRRAAENFPRGFDQPKTVFIGSSVARKLAYQQGDQLTIAAGMTPALNDEYSTRFTIQQILPETNTPVDDTILISLEDLQQAREAHGSPPDPVNFFMIRLHSRKALLAMQQSLPQQLDTPLTVVIPAAELEKLARYEALIDQIMIIMSLIIGGLALILVFFNLSAGFAERRPELELLRMVGAKPRQLATLTLAEPLLQILIAIVLGTILYLPACILFDIWLPLAGSAMLSFHQLFSLALIFTAGFLLACIPALYIYNLSRKI
ncbi:ABC transporter permease [Endozoicomonadaceae bacterium StTr2]